jgi:hypothetical protein
MSPAYQMIADAFAIRDHNAVVHYLAEHPALIPILPEAECEIHRRFPDAPLDIAIVEDYECGEYRQLFIHVHTTLEAREALELMEKFDVEWFLDADTRCDHSFNVDLRFDN